MTDLDLLLEKCRDALDGGFKALERMSTGEQVSVALVLNRADWLYELGYTLVEAIERAGPEWVSLMPEAARLLAAESGGFRP